MHIIRPEYIFLSTDRLSGRNDVTLGKVNFRPDIRPNVFSKEMRTLNLLAVKTI